MGSFGVAFLEGEVILAEGECQQRQSYFTDSLCESNKILAEHWAFYTWTAWQMPNRAAGSTPAQKHSGWLWPHWVRCSWSISPLSELQAPRPVAVYGTVSKRNRSDARPSIKGSAQPSAKAQGNVWPMGRQTRAIEQAAIFTFSHPDGCYETRKHDVPESVWDDKTTLVDHANPIMSKPQLLLSALLIPEALQRTRFSFRCLILLKDLRNAQGHKLFFS